MPSLISGYEYDIFISYRHKDNKYDGWVTDFVSNLKKELEATFKEDISIYFDENPYDGLLETHDVDESLKTKLKCLIFIPIISQTYCDPKCFAWNNEFLAFNKLASEDQFGPKVKLANGNVTSRILPVKIHELDQTDRELLENELGSLRSVDFIFRSPGINRPLRAKDDDLKEIAHSVFYRNQVNKVANAIKEIITGIRADETSTSDEIGAKFIQPRKSFKKNIALTSMLIIVLALTGYLILTFLSSREKSFDLEKSIAVLAFDDLSPTSDQGYLSDGIAEELIYSLSKIPELKVVGRHSAFTYKGKNVDLRVAGNDLGVASILTGSVRKSDNRIRILVQLVNCDNGFQIWSEQYDKEMGDILNIQQDIAASVVRLFNLSIVKDGSMQHRRIPNTEAYEIYLQARQNLALRGVDNLKVARALFEKSIKMDPQFSPAYSGLGRVLTLLPYYAYTITSQEAVIAGGQAVASALEIDPLNAEAYAVRGTLAGYYEWNWKTAEESLLKAFEMAPQNAEIVNFLGDFFRQIRNKRMMEIEQLAVSLDPLRPINYYDLSSSYHLLGDYKNGIITLQKAFDMSPLAFDGISKSLVQSYLELGEIEKAKEIVLKVDSLNIDGTRSELLLQLKALLILMTKEGRVPTLELTELELLAKSGKTNTFAVAQLFMRAGLEDKALEMLDLAYKQRSFSLVTSSLKLFKTNKRFEEIFARPGLAELVAIRKINGYDY